MRDGAVTDTIKPNGDRDRPSDCEAAKNPRGPAMGPPEGTASSGSTSPPARHGIAARAGRRVWVLARHHRRGRHRASPPTQRRIMGQRHRHSPEGLPSKAHLRRLVKNERERTGGSTARVTPTFTAFSQVRHPPKQPAWSLPLVENTGRSNARSLAEHVEEIWGSRGTPRCRPSWTALGSPTSMRLVAREAIDSDDPRRVGGDDR
jgi:hypothetical protein